MIWETLTPNLKPSAASGITGVTSQFDSICPALTWQGQGSLLSSLVHHLSFPPCNIEFVALDQEERYDTHKSDSEIVGIATGVAMEIRNGVNVVMRVGRAMQPSRASLHTRTHARIAIVTCDTCSSPRHPKNRAQLWQNRHVWRRRCRGVWFERCSVEVCDPHEHGGAK